MKAKKKLVVFRVFCKNYFPFGKQRRVSEEKITTHVVFFGMLRQNMKHIAIMTCNLYAFLNNILADKMMKLDCEKMFLASN